MAVIRKRRKLSLMTDLGLCLPLSATSARCRTVANNSDKNTSAKILQPERKVALESRTKPPVFPVQALRACERATVGG
ncbi:hypothetical protein HMPREF6485_2639 [Segatella buccae ATCC 33574]|uniref:Uncharacterized protein n=1 Tax=Segatella buccae ATCC 33574 TaxID=873513 RepID=E6KAK3_9BACT|nr:hypothetical protein HMPREF6485_2639 [Segatella buccae ATCC 33574]